MDKLTQAEQKLIVQFQKWFEATGIELKVSELRKEIGIPPEGIQITDEDRKQLGSLSLTPKNLPFTVKGKITMCLRGCFAGTRELLEDGLPVLNNFYFREVLKAYVFFNQFLFEDVRASMPIDLRLKNLCNLGDARESLEEHLGIEGRDDFDPELAEIYINSQRELTAVFPITLSIHPEASQRDVLDFIKKSWDFIKILQDRRKNKSTKVLHSRTKINEPIKERNKLIYEFHLSGKSTKEIRKELVKRNQFLDDGHILKIISLEKNKHEKK